MKRFFLFLMIISVLAFSGCGKTSSGEDVLQNSDSLSESEGKAEAETEEEEKEPSEEDILELLMYQVELYERGNGGFPIGTESNSNAWDFAVVFVKDLNSDEELWLRKTLAPLIFEYWLGGKVPEETTLYPAEEYERNISLKEYEIGEETAKIVVSRYFNDVELWESEYVFTKEKANDEILGSEAAKLTRGGFYWRYESVTLLEPEEGNETVVISTAEELADLCERVNRGEASAVNGKFVLGNDIDMSGYEWQPMGRTLLNEMYADEYVYAKVNNGFNGEFDGAGYSISGIEVIGAYANKELGFFGRIGPYAYVHDLTVFGSISDDGNGAGENGYFVGGFAGAIHYGAKVENCRFEGTVEGHSGVGGFAGSIGYAPYSSEDGYSVETAVSGCSAKADVTANYECGGFAGTIYDGVSDCEAVGTLNIIAEGWRPNIIGGFVGGLICDVENCKAAVTINYDVDAPDWMGNFAGELVFELDIINCAVDTDNLHEGWRLIGMQHYKNCEIDISKENWYAE